MYMAKMIIEYIQYIHVINALCIMCNWGIHEKQKTIRNLWTSIKYLSFSLKIKILSCFQYF